VTGCRYPSLQFLVRLVLMDFPNHGKSGFPLSEQDIAQRRVRFQQENPARAARQSAGPTRHR
ncbi:MAG: hypothetical protein KI788_13690, partial [Mameliella sp.]|nr:hypothetical protein [Mameliella sp.]